MIKGEVGRVIEKKGLTGEETYYWIFKGLYGGDRDIDSLS